MDVILGGAAAGGMASPANASAAASFGPSPTTSVDPFRFECSLSISGFSSGIAPACQCSMPSWPASSCTASSVSPGNRMTSAPGGIQTCDACRRTVAKVIASPKFLNPGRTQSQE